MKAASDLFAKFGQINRRTSATGTRRYYEETNIAESNKTHDYPHPKRIGHTVFYIREYAIPYDVDIYKYDHISLSIYL